MFRILLLALGLALPSRAAVDLTDAGPDTFPLVADGRAAPIHLPADPPTVIRLAAEGLAADIERVTGLKPEIVGHPDGIAPEKPVGWPRIDLRLRDIGRWETFQLESTPLVLTISGSDARGLAFGIYDLSRKIGVSPWHWWADVPVGHRDTLHLTTGKGPPEAPAVKYRGIFLNDEDWGLEPWAARTFEPETGTIGPKTYARIFELLLRLRANTVWPAMHECTTPFFQVPGNNKVADDHAIVIGSSHAEPMLRNNVGEWKAPKDRYNYLAHRDEVLGYWEERVKQRTGGESLFTLGMRGVHDSAIVGPRNQKERVDTLERIFTDQRRLLSTHLGKPPERIGQIFCPYKEVLDDYHAGLRVPDDVTLVWPDDNFGYIRHFPSDAERERPGGSGVYYHLSYLGAPMSWLWFDSLPPALVWSEMKRAYDLGSREVWIANVGDLKGNELSTAWFLDLAWHADTHGPDSGMEFLERFAAETFGPEPAADVADLWRRHQHLAFARKPEHLQWHLPLTPYQPCEMTDAEIVARVEAYRSLNHDAAELMASLPESHADAAFQLLGYPIACAYAANLRYLSLELVRRGHPAGDLETARAADRDLHELTRRYNEEIADGKWRHIMSAHGLSPRAWLRFQPTSFEAQLKDLEHGKTEPEAGSVSPEVPDGLTGPGFYEFDRVVSIHAGNFTGKGEARGAGWCPVPGLGRTGNAVAVVPEAEGGTPELTYRFHVASGGPATVHVRLLPTHPVRGDERRIGLAVDDSETLTLTGKDPKPKSDAWNREVLSNATTLSRKLPDELKPGWHTLRLIALDPGIVADKIILDLGGLKPTYDGPPETRLE